MLQIFFDYLLYYLYICRAVPTVNLRKSFYFTILLFSSFFSEDIFTEIYV